MERLRRQIIFKFHVYKGTSNNTELTQKTFKIKTNLISPTENNLNNKNRYAFELETIDVSQILSMQFSKENISVHIRSSKGMGHHRRG